MTNAIVKKMPFGKAPKVDNVTLPAFRSIADDNKLGAAIGSIGGGAGGVQRLMCSTAYYVGDAAKAAKTTDYTGDNYFSGFYDTHYAAKPLTDGAKAQAKANALIYVKVAMLPYDARSLAETMFDHPHGSMNQKATALRKMAKEHPEKAPSKAEFAAYLPAEPVKTDATLFDRAQDVFKSIDNVYTRRDKPDAIKLWAEVSADKALQAEYEKAVSACKAFFTLVEKMAKAKADKATKRNGRNKPAPQPEVSASVN